MSAKTCLAVISQSIIGTLSRLFGQMNGYAQFFSWKLKIEYWLLDLLLNLSLKFCFFKSYQTITLLATGRNTNAHILFKSK